LLYGRPEFESRLGTPEFWDFHPETRIQWSKKHQLPAPVTSTGKQARLGALRKKKEKK
jgi:hypothetical protein